MQRRLEPEILDSLPHHHPDALRNRRDLHVTNHLLGNYRWFLRTLPSLLRPGERALELGAGTGELGTRLARRGIPVGGLDLWQRPQGWPATCPWHVADLRTFEGYARYAAIFGNLIFHQFSPEELTDIGIRLRESTRLIVASELVRRRRSQILFRVIAPVLRVNYVTRHDAHVSIAAGFRDRELPRALGLESDQWDILCSENSFGSYRMVAIKRA